MSEISSFDLCISLRDEGQFTQIKLSHMKAHCCSRVFELNSDQNLPIFTEVTNMKQPKSLIYDLVSQDKVLVSGTAVFHIIEENSLNETVCVCDLRSCLQLFIIRRMSMTLFTTAYVHEVTHTANNLQGRIVLIPIDWLN